MNFVIALGHGLWRLFVAGMRWVVFKIVLIAVLFAFFLLWHRGELVWILDAALLVWNFAGSVLGGVLPKVGMILSGLLTWVFSYVQLDSVVAFIDGIVQWAWSALVKGLSFYTNKWVPWIKGTLPSIDVPPLELNVLGAKVRIDWANQLRSWIADRVRSDEVQPLMRLPEVLFLMRVAYLGLRALLDRYVFRRPQVVVVEAQPVAPANNVAVLDPTARRRAAR